MTAATDAPDALPPTRLLAFPSDRRLAARLADVNDPISDELLAYLEDVLNTFAPVEPTPGGE